MPFVFHCFASALNALEKFINFNSIRDWPGKVKGKVYPRHGAAPDKDDFLVCRECPYRLRVPPKFPLPPASILMKKNLR